MKPHQFAFGAAIALLVIAALFATLGVTNSAPTCPLGAMMVPERRDVACALPVNPENAPSSVVVTPVSVDHKYVERLLILATGVLGTVFLLALAIRIRSSDSIGADTASS